MNWRLRVKYDEARHILDGLTEMDCVDCGMPNEPLSKREYQLLKDIIDSAERMEEANDASKKDS